MVIKSELEYRYILKILDSQIDIIKELRCEHLKDLGKALPEISNVAVYTRVEKLRNKVILAFKQNGSKYPFSVDV